MKATSLALALLVVACYSPGPYGYSRTYTPLDEEEDLAESAQELDPVMVQRTPEEWKNKNVSVFGVVKSRKDAPGGGADLTLSMRNLAERNLCDEADEATCRVTISSREHAIVHVMVKLTGEDDIGKNSVANGSLIRVIGRVRDGVDADDGALIVTAKYHRHWPRGEYVTNADADHMRR